MEKFDDKAAIAAADRELHATSRTRQVAARILDSEIGRVVQGNIRFVRKALPYGVAIATMAASVELGVQVAESPRKCLDALEKGEGLPAACALLSPNFPGDPYPYPYGPGPSGNEQPTPYSSPSQPGLPPVTQVPPTHTMHHFE